MRFIIVMLLCGMLLSFTVYAEDTDIKVPVPLDLVTGTRPTTTYNMYESAIPFVKASWGMSFDEVLAITNGRANDEKTEILQIITLPELNGEQTIIYHFQDGGLKSVSMNVLNNATSDSPELSEKFKALATIAKKYTTVKNGDNPDVCLLIKNKSYYVYKSTVTDIVYGYFLNGTTYDVNIVFSKAATFDESIFRNTDYFSATVSSNGRTHYYDAMKRIYSFLTDYSRKSKTNGCGFASLIPIDGSELTSINIIPHYQMIFSYTGAVSPQSVKYFVFQIDGKIYQLYPSEGKTTINSFNEYARQFEFLIDAESIVFMEALASTSKPVIVEIRGDDGFVLSFEMPDKSIKMLSEDWSIFKKAGGTADVYLRTRGAKFNVR